MSVFSRHFLTVLFMLSAFAVLAQDEPDDGPRVGSSIIDDSTKNVYGPKTRLYFYEGDFFRKNFESHTLDTAT